MKKVYLIHGFEGSPNGGWRPYIMRELEKQDIYACALPMPSPSLPILSEWLFEVERCVEKDKEDEVYLVGHSLGGTTILRYLEKFDHKNIKGIISVSAPCVCKKESSRISEFLKDDFNWDVIKSKINKVVIIHRDDDPFVPLSDAEEIKERLNGKLIIIKNGKHLNGSAGFFELPELLEEIMNMIK